MSVIDSHSDKHDDLNRRVIKRPACPSQAMGAPTSRPAPQHGDCVLTSRDYTLLEAWLIRALGSELEIDPMLIALVRAKLAAAQIVLTGDVEANRARGGSRVVYVLDRAAAPVSQLLSHWRPEAVEQNILPITSILGITLLGMSAGQRVPLIRSDGSIGGVWLEAVDARTERARTDREASTSRAEADEPARQSPPSGTGAADKVLPFPPARHSRKPFTTGRPGGPNDPDPGPTAA
jgi:regulator of nucleoside diphosphate kinase